MCGPSSTTSRAPGTRSLISRVRETGDAASAEPGEAARRNRDLAEPRDDVVTRDREPAVGKARGLEREQRAPRVGDARMLRPHRQRRRREPARQRLLEHPRHAVGEHARRALLHRRRIGRCAGAGDQQRLHALRVADRDVLRHHAPERHAGERERALVGRRDLIGQARHRRRLGRSWTPAEAREGVLDGRHAGQRHSLPAAGVQADRGQQHERHAAKYYAPRWARALAGRC